MTTLKLYRPAQDSLTICFAENLVSKSDVAVLHQTTTSLSAASSVRIYRLKSLASLHELQFLVTGFSVVHDGLATFFSISRRRMVVPIYKRLEATLARVQIIRDDDHIQLLLFLADFVHGKCMNLFLKGTDTYEMFEKSKKFYVRFVDAKFAMPKTDDEEGWDMICLDLVEYPTEHDDIMIGFDTEDGKSGSARYLVLASLPIYTVQ